MSATTTAPVHGSYLMPALEHATVSDAMHPGILTCDPGATVTDVARLMATNHVHSIAVMGISHELAGERLAWGIVSDLDVLRAAVRNGSDQPAAALALEPVVIVEPSMPLLEAAELMLEKHASHVVVIDPRAQRPVGILSTLDVAGIVAWGEG